MPSVTMCRPAVMHVWPWQWKLDQAPIIVACSRSASSSTISALLPPSSSDTFFRRPPAVRAIWRPTAVEPVKWIITMSGWVTRRSPTSTSPGSTWKSPAGSPAPANNSARASPPDSGVSGDGLISTAFPSVSAGAITRMPSTSGKFHGVITPTSPTATRSQMESRPRCVVGTSSPGGAEASAAASSGVADMAQVSRTSRRRRRVGVGGEPATARLGPRRRRRRV